MALDREECRRSLAASFQDEMKMKQAMYLSAEGSFQSPHLGYGRKRCGPIQTGKMAKYLLATGLILER